MSQSESKFKVQAQGFFKRVHLSERKNLFQQIAHKKIPLVMKAESEELIPVVAFRIEGEEQLYIALEPGATPLQPEQAVVVNFAMAEERYFFLSKIGFEGQVPFLRIDVDLFQLQRRQNVRIEIPEDYQAAVNIIEINEKPSFLESRVRDISAGGCQVGLETKESFAIGDKLLMVLHLGHRRPMKFRVEVRFANDTKSEKILGLQFLDRDSILENKLLSLMTDFQRELYLKYTVDPS